MGLRHLLRRRRERESAFSPVELEQLQRGASEPAGPGAAAEADGSRVAIAESAGTEPDAAPAEADATELPGGSPAELAQMIARAISSGTAQISTESHDLDPVGLRDQIFAALSKHYLGPSADDSPTGPSNPREQPGASSS